MRGFFLIIGWSSDKVKGLSFFDRGITCAVFQSVEKVLVSMLLFIMTVKISRFVGRVISNMSMSIFVVLSDTFKSVFTRPPNLLQQNLILYKVITV